jgi:4-hydroxybenzoate polyprenyltransferase
VNERGRPSARLAVAVSRPLFWLNSASLCVVAQMLSDRPVGLPALVLIVFATWPLNLFVYGWNDLHDHASDLANARKGTAEGARADLGTLRSLARWSCWVNAPFAIFFAATGPAQALLPLAAIYLIAWTYSAPPLRLKSRPGWDSLANAGYALPLLLGWAYLGVESPPWREAIALAVWAIGSHSFTSIQDVTADRASGLRTIATELGARGAAAIALVAYGVAGLILVPLHPVSSLLLLGHVVIVLAFLVRPSLHDAHRAYRRFMSWNVVCGFVVVTAIALAHPEQTFTAAVVMLALCMAVAIAVVVARAPRAGAAMASPVRSGS